ncbi:hypothetical protein QE152_g32002 [Popillia japonica]|uniref:Uncharacterized protein n=1 Tax=Popillia japonica TaxID=7064 RepID=A0AAW1J116_POPJA
MLTNFNKQSAFTACQTRLYRNLVSVYNEIKYLSPYKSVKEKNAKTSYTHRNVPYFQVPTFLNFRRTIHDTSRSQTPVARTLVIESPAVGASFHGRDIKNTLIESTMPSLLEALEQKYGESSTESEGSEEEGISVSIYVPRKSPRLTVPSLLVLNDCDIATAAKLDCDIATAGEQQALVDKCAAVEELDLAKNKLNYWPEVFGILQQMPKLKFVNLSFNQLSMPLKQTDVDVNIRWDYLRNLVLNSTQIDWKSVQQILDYSPTLEELHLSLVISYSTPRRSIGRASNRFWTTPQLWKNFI